MTFPEDKGMGSLRSSLVPVIRDMTVACGEQLEEAAARNIRTVNICFKLVAFRKQTTKIFA